MSIPHNNMRPPPASPPPPNNNGPPPVVRPNGQAPRSIEELCQPSIDRRGGPIAPIAIQATDFGLRHHMIQQNGVSDDALCLSLFPYSLTHHAITWLRNEITKFEQKQHESLFEAWERYKLSIDRCPNHNMLLVTQIDTFYNGLTLTTQDKTSRNISSTTSTESPEVVRQLELMNKNFVEMMRQIQSVKSMNLKCETCGGPHFFIEFPAADGYTQEAAYATTGNYNSGGNSYQPQGDSNLLSYRSNNYLGPPGFNQPNVQNNQNRYNQNQNQGNFQAPNYQAQVGPSNELTNYMKSNKATLRAMQTQMTNMKTELRNEFKSTIDARTNKTENQNNQIMNILTNMQNQNSSGSGSLPSNTVANPRGDVKAITTQSGVAYNGPTIPPTPSPLPKEVERETEATKDKVQNTSLGSTAHVQPLVVQDPIPEPEVAPKTNPKPSIPYPSRLNDQKLREKANNQMLKFLQIFQRLHFDICFADALLYMPKFASTSKSLLSNKEKLFELASTPLNENCSAMLLKKLLKKLGDPDKFLISCDFLELDECLALADLGASINLMPLSVWKQLLLPELTSTRMTLELVDRSTVHPKGVAEVVFMKVEKFYFLADFVVVDYDVDPLVPLILGRPFLRTTRALIDVYGEELTLRVDDEAITFKVGQTLRYSRSYETVNQVNVIDVACEEYAQEVLGFSDSSLSGNPTPSDPIIASSSPSFTPFEGGDFILEEIETFLHTPDELSNLDDDYYDTEGDILYVEKLLNEDSSLTLPPMKNDDLKQVDVTMMKLSTEEPPELGLKDLPSHLEYAFLEGSDKLPVIISKELKEEEKAALLKLNDATCKDHFPLPFMDQMLERLAWNEYYCFLDGFSGYFQIPIDPQDQEKTTFTFPYGTFTYRRMPFGLCNAPGTFQRCMMANFHDMIEEIMEVFLDDFSILENSFSSCLSYLDKMLKRCKDTNLVLNWEKCHFMVKEDIVLGHKISKSGIEVNQAKVNVTAKLPHPTSVKGGINFMGPFPSSRGNKYILVAIDYLSKCIEAKALPTNDARVVVKFLKSLYARFGTPCAIISDHGTHFCNDQFAKVMLKYGVTHRLSTIYHPQTSGQVEVSNRSLKRILERTIGLPRIMMTPVLVVLSIIHSIFSPSHAYIWESDILDLID
ncbi:reverse transcriptase domain-containing protein [Tanacetum coccineum]